VLSPELSSGDLSGEDIETEPRDAEAPALSLPRAESLARIEQLRQRSMAPQSETHTVEGTQQTRSASPEPEGAGNEQSKHPLSERQQRIRNNNEPSQAEPEEPATRSGSSMGRRVLMVLALLVGLIFVAAIKTDLGDRLTGFLFPATVETSSPASTVPLTPSPSGTPTGM
jgi:hypothetical protein